jgi:hypothetical protein
MAELENQRAAFPATNPRPGAIDWREVARAAFGSAVLAGALSGGIYLLGKLVEEHNARVNAAARATQPPNAAEDEPEESSDDDAAIDAARLLGVRVDASANEVRAALRTRLANSRLHPDQGGDGDAAKRLIAAKNLLIDRIKGRVR